MNETSAPLERDMIAQPELWRMSMLVGPRRLDVCLLPPVENEPMLFRSLMLDGDASTPTKALEDTIYANPLLLSDFSSVNCLFDTPQALIVPAEVDPADHAMLLRRAFLLDDAEAVVSETGDDNAVIITAPDADRKNFLARTFFNIRFDNHLAPLCRYLTPMADGPTVYALCRHDCVDLIAADRQRLQAANTFETSTAADAAYYILATARILGFDRPTAAIGGDAAAAAALTGVLSRFDGFTLRQLELPPMKFKLPLQGGDFPLQLTLCHNNANNTR